MSDILFSNVDDIIEEVREYWDGEEDPDDLFSTVKSSLMYFREEGSDERSSQAEEFLERIRDAVSDMYWQQEEVPDVEALEAEETTIGEEAVHFGIFEDVDQ